MGAPSQPTVQRERAGTRLRRRQKVYGRKRHLLTDTLGLLITACVHSAQLYDGASAKQVFTATKAL